MKTIWVILMFITFFNIAVMLTNSLEIFPVTPLTSTLTPEEIEEYENMSTDQQNLSLWGALGFHTENGDIPAVLVALGFIGGAVALAKFTHSPVPLGVGAFLAFTVGLWVKTYMTFYQEGFGINQYLLTIGMVGMLIMFIATTSEMMSQQQVG